MVNPYRKEASWKWSGCNVTYTSPIIHSKPILPTTLIRSYKVYITDIPSSKTPKRRIYWYWQFSVRRLIKLAGEMSFRKSDITAPYTRPSIVMTRSHPVTHIKLQRLEKKRRRLASCPNGNGEHVSEEWGS